MEKKKTLRKKEIKKRNQTNKMKKVETGENYTAYYREMIYETSFCEREVSIEQVSGDQFRLNKSNCNSIPPKQRNEQFLPSGKYEFSDRPDAEQDPEIEVQEAAENTEDGTNCSEVPSPDFEIESLLSSTTWNLEKKSESPTKDIKNEPCGSETINRAVQGSESEGEQIDDLDSCCGSSRVSCDAIWRGESEIAESGDAPNLSKRQNNSKLKSQEMFDSENEPKIEGKNCDNNKIIEKLSLNGINKWRKKIDADHFNLIFDSEPKHKPIKISDFGIKLQKLKESEENSDINEINDRNEINSGFNFEKYRDTFNGQPSDSLSKQCCYKLKRKLNDAPKEHEIDFERKSVRDLIVQFEKLRKRETGVTKSKNVNKEITSDVITSGEREPILKKNEHDKIQNGIEDCKPSKSRLCRRSVGSRRFWYFLKCCSSSAVVYLISVFCLISVCCGLYMFFFI